MKKHSIFPLVTFHDNSFETGLVIQGQNWRTELVLVHLVGRVPELHLAVFRLKHNPNCNPSWQIELPLREARLLRDLLNRPEITHYLEQD